MAEHKSLPEQLNALGFKVSKEAVRGSKSPSLKAPAKGRRDDNPGPRKKDARGEDKMPQRWLPIYKELKDKLNQDTTRPIVVGSTANTGLLFDKFCDHWSGPTKWKAETPRKQKAVKQRFFDEIKKHLGGNTTAEGLLTQYDIRRKKLIIQIDGGVETYKTTQRFISGLGMGHVLETGFVWHRTLGVPYLPGSSVKGMLKAWAEQWDEEYQPEEKRKEVLRLFGDTKDNGAGSLIVFDAIPSMLPDTSANAGVLRLFGDTKDNGAGSLIVFDAIPVKKPELEVDIMNPHYGDYYGKKKIKITIDGIDKEVETPPADYLSPTPIFFLTVAPGSEFKFALAPRPDLRMSPEQKKDDLNEGLNLLEKALGSIGAGAKTAVGYGYFEKKEQP